jgi:hypothetical protein
MEYTAANISGEGYPHTRKTPQSEFAGMIEQLKPEQTSKPVEESTPFTVRSRVPGENRMQRRARERAQKKQMNKSKGVK